MSSVLLVVALRVDAAHVLVEHVRAATIQYY
jgi:hypothetical protein